MALRVLQPPVPCSRPLPSSSRAVLHLPPPQRLDLATGFRIAAASKGGLRGSGAASRKDVDLATLGNLCVDIVLSVPSLPPSPAEERKAYMERLSSSPPDKVILKAPRTNIFELIPHDLVTCAECTSLIHTEHHDQVIVRTQLFSCLFGQCKSVYVAIDTAALCCVDQRHVLCTLDQKYWEAGGNCNLAIAAARLGLQCVTLGHVGDEIYGDFLHDVLQDEGIGLVGMNENSESATSSTTYETLLCWVLVDPFQRHGFCSRADFSENPAFSWMTKLTGTVKSAIQQCKILFCNGYAFDELFPDLIVSALYCAIDSGTTIFFDPGPRGRKLIHGTHEQQRALEQFMRLSDVLLLTSDEAESLTGISNPILAGQELIKKGVRTKWVIIKMSSKGSVLITNSSISCAPAFKVNVVDTVGCGDSFSAAIAFGFLHDMPAVNTITLANAVGAATATGCGAGRNVAKLSKVLEILQESNLSEDVEFWNKLIGEHLERPEVLLLSKTSINGYSDRLVHVPIRNVVSELIPLFEPLCESTVSHA